MTRRRVYGRPLEHVEQERERLEVLGLDYRLVEALAAPAANYRRRQRRAERQASASPSRHAEHAA